MLTAIKFVGSLVALFIVLALLSNHAPRKPETKYQECIETANHLRSDNDTAEFKKNFCDRLSVDPRDMR